MKPNPITVTIPLGHDRTITIETGKLAKQADGSVVLKCGGTMLLATVVSNKEAKEGVDGAPKVIKEGVSKAEAEEIKAKLEAEGASVELK